MPAVEVLLITSRIRELIAKGKLDEECEAMEKSSEPGMQTFDQSLFDLFKSGRITEEKAMQNAESQSNPGVRIRLDKGEAQLEAGLDAN